MRPVFLSEVPIFIPYTCKRCGVGPGNERKYFIDIGVDNDMSLDMREQGAIYFCNECFKNLVTDAQILIHQYDLEHEVGTGTSSEGDAGTVEEPESDPTGSFEFDTESEGLDQPASTAVDDVNPDIQSEPRVRTFASGGESRSGSLTF